ncbi:MAG: YadA family autotransporter adhesin, partial [Achromobacter piechaudii]
VSAPSYSVQGASYSNVGAALGGADTAITNLVAGRIGPFTSNSSIVTTQSVASGADASAGGFGASATGAASTVIGNQATDNAVADSTVLGQGASVDTGLAGSNVVLGQGSSASIGSQSGYIAFGIAASQTSTGEVSVGSGGARRKITNLAAGSALTDAVNVAQLRGAASNVGSSLASGLGGGAAYSPGLGTVSAPAYAIQGTTYSNVGAALGGANSTLSSLISGDIGPFTSDNSVNTTQSVASGVNSIAGGFGASALGATSTVIGNLATDNAVASSTVLGQNASVDTGLAGSNVVLGQGSTASIGSQSGYLSFGITPAQSSAGEVSVGTPGSRRKITNLAAGSALSDAVNVAQLSGAASNLGTTIATRLGGGAAYSVGAGTVSAPAYTIQGTTYSNVGAALGGADTAITGLVQGDIGPFTSDNSVSSVQSVASGANASAGGFGASATGDASTVVGNEASDNGVHESTVLGQGASITAGLTGANVALGQGSVADVGAQAGYAAIGVSGAQSSIGEVSLGTSGAERKITHLAPGSAATDAVNVSQLTGVSNAASAGLSSLGSSMAANLGGGSGFDMATGTVTTPTYDVQGTSFSNLGGAIGGLDSAVASLASGKTGAFVSDDSVRTAQALASGADASAGGFGAVASGDGSTVVGNGASDSGVDHSTAIGQGATITAGLSGANVALGQGSVATVGAQTGYSAIGLAATQDSSGEVSVGATGAERKITNLAAGSAATDAVNVAQLTGVSNAATASVGTLGASVATNLGGGSAFDPVTGTVTAPAYGVQGSTYSNLGSAIDGLDSAVTGLASGKAGAYVADS